MLTPDYTPQPIRVISSVTVGMADSPAAPKPQGRDTLAPLRLAADLLLAKGYRWDNGQWREPATGGTDNGK